MCCKVFLVFDGESIFRELFGIYYKFGEDFYIRVHPKTVSTTNLDVNARGGWIKSNIRQDKLKTRIIPQILMHNIGFLTMKYDLFS